MASQLGRSRQLTVGDNKAVLGGRSRRGAGERHATAPSSHLSTNTNTHDIAIMGALLSLPFLAMPAMGTVCRLPLRDCALLTGPGMERCRLLLRSCYLQRSHGLLWGEMR
jgi:hypothetical protein